MKRTAHFIWTPAQSIDHEAYFRLLSTQSLHRGGDENRWVLFHKRFSLSAVPDAADINITCDGRYMLWLNGDRAGRGPARASPHFMRVDQIDVQERLQSGDNTIAVLVHSPGVDLAWYETTKGAWQPVFGDGGLYVDLALDCDGQRAHICSDETWRCLDAKAWDRAAPRSGWGQDFIEDFDARLFDADWTAPDFDASDWQQAQVLRSEGSLGDKATGRGFYEPFSCLLPRQIAPLAEETIAPAKLVWTQSVSPRPDLPIDQRLYQEELTPAKAGMFANAPNLVTPDGPPALVTTTGATDASIMLKFDPYITGCPFIDIEAHGGEIIEVAAGEALPGEFDKANPKSGLKRPNHLTFAHIFRYHAKAGRQRFEKFEFTAVRALQITVRNAPKGIKIHHVGVRTLNYPAPLDGAFSCSDPLLDRLWQVGRHTALQCMHDAYEDCPGREKRQWIGDGVIHFDIAAAGFGPGAYALGRQFFMHGAESQRPDGLLQMFTPGDHRGDGVCIPDFTLLWIIGVEKYWLASADETLVEAVFPAIEKALAWFYRQSDASALLSGIPFWHFIEWAHVGRHGQSAPINALYAGALQAAANLAKLIESHRAARRYSARAAAVKAALNDRHWNDARTVYVDEVDPDTGKQGQRVSQQANALMIAFDIAPKSRWPGIIETICDETALKFTAAPPIFVNAPPFDEARDIVRANTFYCHFLYEALAKAGRFDLALDHMRDYYEPMLDAGATTLWESFEPSASLCHVFSATPVYQLSRHALGVQAMDAGFARVNIAPQFGDLQWAKGTYPTPLGDVDVSWRKGGKTITLTVTSPAHMQIEITPPAAHKITARDAQTKGDRCVTRLTLCQK